MQVADKGYPDAIVAVGARVANGLAMAFIAAVGARLANESDPVRQAAVEALSRLQRSATQIPSRQ